MSSIKNLSKHIDTLNSVDSLEAKKAALNEMTKYQSKLTGLEVAEAVIELNEDLHEAYKIIYYLKLKIK